jgi:hypothetical protein
MSTRTIAWVAAVLAAACSRSSPAPKVIAPLPADHQSAIALRTDDVANSKYRLASGSTFRFAPPVQGRVATWHWHPQVDGRSHAFGYHHGWCVDYWFTPDYEGYPEQPEAQRMAFFADGELRGLFAPGSRNAPLELDKWCVVWVDPTWGRVQAPGAAPR